MVFIYINVKNSQEQVLLKFKFNANLLIVLSIQIIGRGLMIWNKLLAVL